MRAMMGWILLFVYAESMYGYHMPHLLTAWITGDKTPITSIQSPDSTIRVTSPAPGVVSLSVPPGYRPGKNIIAAVLRTSSATYRDMVVDCINLDTLGYTGWKLAAPHEIVYACSSGLISCGNVNIHSDNIITTYDYFNGHRISVAVINPGAGTVSFSSNINIPQSRTYMCVLPSHKNNIVSSGPSPNVERDKPADTLPHPHAWVEGNTRLITSVYSPDNSIIVDSSIEGRIGLSSTLIRDTIGYRLYHAVLRTTNSNYGNMVFQCANLDTLGFRDWRLASPQDVIYACEKGLMNCSSNIYVATSDVGSQSVIGGQYVFLISAVNLSTGQIWHINFGLSGGTYATRTYVCVR